MSTDNIPQLKQQRGALRTTGREVKERAAKVREELDGLDETEAEVRIGTEAVLEDIDNERIPLVEEGEELTGIIRRARQASEPTPSATPPNGQGNVPPTQPPQPLAPPVTTAPEDPPTAEIPAQPAPASNQPHPFDVRHWEFIQWIFAILGLIAGLIVARYTWLPLFGDIHGAGRGWLAVPWFIVLAGLGFYSFGWIGSFVLLWWRRRNN